MIACHGEYFTPFCITTSIVLDSGSSTKWIRRLSKAHEGNTFFLSFVPFEIFVVKASCTRIEMYIVELPELAPMILYGIIAPFFSRT